MGVPDSEEHSFCGGLTRAKKRWVAVHFLGVGVEGLGSLV